MKPKYNPEEVAELFGVDNNTLKLWRSPQRLRGGIDNPLHLPVSTDPDNKNIVWYAHDDLVAFIKRNDKYRDRLYAAYVPDEVRAAFLPRALQPACDGWHNVVETLQGQTP